MYIIKENKKRINYVKVHIISDLNLPLEEEINGTFKIEIYKLLDALDDLIHTSNIIISNIDNKMLIINNGNRMVSLLLKENDIDWHFIMKQRIKTLDLRKESNI